MSTATREIAARAARGEEAKALLLIQIEFEDRMGGER